MRLLISGYGGASGHTAGVFDAAAARFIWESGIPGISFMCVGEDARTMGERAEPAAAQPKEQATIQTEATIQPSAPALFGAGEYAGYGKVYMFKPSPDYRPVAELDIPGGALCHIAYSPQVRMLAGACYENGDFFVVPVTEDGFGEMVAYLRQGADEQAQPGTSGESDTSGTSDTSSASDLSDTSGASDSSDTSGASDSSDTSGASDSSGTPGVSKDVRSRAHCAVFSEDGRFIYSANIALDRIYCYECQEGNLLERGYVQLPKGVGPRHILLLGDCLYIITEYSNEIITLRVIVPEKSSSQSAASTSYLSPPISRISILPDGFGRHNLGNGSGSASENANESVNANANANENADKNANANKNANENADDSESVVVSYGSALCFLPDDNGNGERGFLYAANRGANTVAVFKREMDGSLVKVWDWPCLGDWPRHIAIINVDDDDSLPVGPYLAVANERSNRVSLCPINPIDGKPGDEALGIPFGGASYVESF